MATAGPERPYKLPESVLVVIHTPALDVLLIRRTDGEGHWQSVTGSQEGDETLRATASREVAEETGLAAPENALLDWRQSNRFEIFPEWRHRYAPGVHQNTEHVFSLEVASPRPVRLAPDEHIAFLWLPLAQAAAKCFSWTNRDAILALPGKIAR